MRWPEPKVILEYLRSHPGGRTTIQIVDGVFAEYPLSQWERELYAVHWVGQKLQVMRRHGIVAVLGKVPSHGDRGTLVNVWAITEGVAS